MFARTTMSFYLVEPHPRFTCAEGHSQRKLALYPSGGPTLWPILDGCVFRGSTPVYVSDDHEVNEVGRLVLTRRETLALADEVSGPHLVHSVCAECVPIYYVEEVNGEPRVRARRLVSRWVLEFDRGRISSIRDGQKETRAEVTAQMVSDGIAVRNVMDPDVVELFTRWRWEQTSARPSILGSGF